MPEWNLKRKFCSRNCDNIWRKGKNFSPSTQFSKERHFVPPTAFREGQRPSIKTEFKKGNVPWTAGNKLSVEHYKKLKNAGFFDPKYGDKSGNWKGGRTALGKLIRSCKNYKEWRLKIFIRDNYSCVWCNARSCAGNKVIIHADHIKPFCEIIEENNITNIHEALICEELWDINNGRTLCFPCHKKTLTYLINQYTKKILRCPESIIRCAGKSALKR